MLDGLNWKFITILGAVFVGVIGGVITIMITIGTISASRVESLTERSAQTERDTGAKLLDHEHRITVHDCILEVIDCTPPERK